MGMYMQNSTVRRIFEEASYLEEDYPTQRRQYIREKLIEAAIREADLIIMDGADGSVEELNWLTSAVALRFAEKVHIANQAQLQIKEVIDRVGT